MVALSSTLIHVKHQLRKIGALSLLCLAVNCLFFISSMLFGELGFQALTTLPATSPFIHASMTHFVENVIMLLVLMLPQVNSHFTIKELVLLAIGLALLYLPFVLLGFSVSVIGLSGLGYFLLTRFILANTFFRKTLLVLFTLLLLGELTLLGSADDVAHGFHLFAVLSGGIVFKLKKKSNAEL
jgi:hypothetical protein